MNVPQIYAIAAGGVFAFLLIMKSVSAVQHGFLLSPFSRPNTLPIRSSYDIAAFWDRGVLPMSFKSFT